MSDEKIVHVAPETNPVQPHNTDPDQQRNPVGKIARLPYKIREQLNRRLRNNEPDSEILPWLEGLPAVKKILAAQFDGKPINHQNLSNWRRGGHKQWLQRQEEVDEMRGLVEDAKDFSRTSDGSLAHGTASIVAAKMLKTVHAIPAEQSSVNDLMKISYAVSALVNADQNEVRLKHEETRVFQGNERLVLSWDKFLRDCVETAQRALNSAIAKDIQAADIDNGEKIELLGHELFGKKWQGRAVGKKEEPSCA
jgi:hypothetical protein